MPDDSNHPIVSGLFFPASRDTWDPRADPEALKEKDPFDARPKGQWRSLYPEPLHRIISHELLYLGACFGIGIIAAAGAMAQNYGYALTGLPTLPGGLATALAHGTLAFAGGLVGGTLFSLKWLYHSVAKGMWHLDRRLWRFSTPWISAGLAIAVLALIRGEALRLFNPAIFQHPSGVFGVSFLVGYFSDVTIGKLNEIADVLFAPGRGEKGVSRYSTFEETRSPGKAATSGDSAAGTGHLKED